MNSTTSPMATSPSRQVLVLIAVILACFSVPLNFTAGPTAQPYIAKDLVGGAAALSWITNAFFLSCGSTLMAAGAMADQYGRKKIFAIGMVVSTVMSFLMPFASSVFTLDLLRVPQGLAAACAYSGGISILAQEFEGHARTRIFSVIGITFGAGLAFGPTIAGILITLLSWRAVFFGSTIISLVALVLCVTSMTDSKDPNARGLDWWGASIFTLMLSCFTFAMIEAPTAGWTAPLTIGLFALSAVALVVFVVVEKRVANPMLDLSLFAYPQFVGVQLLPLAAAYCYAVLLVVLPLRFIGIENLSALQSGVLMIYFSGSLLFIPFVAASMTRYVPVGVLAGVGMLISVIGMFFLMHVPIGDHGMAMRINLAVIGFGVAIPWGLMDNLAVSVVPKEKAGMAIGIFGALRVSFDTTAIAIVGSLLAFFIARNLGAIPGLDPQAVAVASAQLSAGAVPKALSQLPSVTHAQWLDAYDLAFRHLLIALMTLTSAATLLVFGLLGRVSLNHDESNAESSLGVTLTKELSGQES
ncbi:MFS transporter [Paraburkholderia megapolitana]|nr:MFS transporter [Paraburkholderia megapolitana]